MSEVTRVLKKIDAGDLSAAEQLLPLVYGELRKLAAAKLAREAPGSTLQPTALVHEAWIRLGADEQPTWNDRAHFFAAAAESMRRILIEAARRRRAVRHGGSLERLDVDAAVEVAAPADDEEMLLVHEALDEFAALDARKAALVKQRYFVGLTLVEIAEVSGISIATAERDWAYARAWLFDKIKTLRR